MKLPTPFAYPKKPHSRRHGPKGYADYGSYKPFLRDDFMFRCVYCLEREAFYPNRSNAFSADHFTPKVVDPSRKEDYDNLVYACGRCNSFKQHNITQLDPTKVAFASHFRVEADGHIQGLTVEGQDLIDLLHLDEDPALKVRRMILGLLKLKSSDPNDPTIHSLFVYHFGFPDHLPDLGALEPPAGNSKPDGVNKSYFTQRQQGKLPEWY